MNALSSIQTRVSLLLLIFGLAVLGLNAWDNASWIRKLQMRSLKDDAEAQGTLIAGMMQHCFRNHLRRAAELQMSYASTVPGLVDGAVVDEDDVIQFATRLDWIGMKLQESRLNDLLPLARRAREQMTGGVEEGGNAEAIMAAHPFFTRYDSQHRGVVLLRFHGEELLRQASAEALHVSIAQALVLLSLCAMLWIVMDFLVTGRVRRLLDQARVHGEGAAAAQPLDGEDELAMISQAFAGAVRRVQQTEAQLLEASEDERRRIGSDLHDDVCQRITAAQLKSGVLHAALAREQHPQATLAAAVAEELAKSARAARSFARGLAPMLVQRGRLAESLRELASALSESFTVACECACRMEGEPLALWVDTHVYRIMQELMTNAMKHARPAQVRGSVLVKDGVMLLTVESDGLAYEPAASVPGIGLDSVRQRVRALGGSFRISAGSSGTGSFAQCEVRLMEPHYTDVEDAGS